MLHIQEAPSRKLFKHQVFEDVGSEM